jgi:hypothetical protein
MERTILFAGAVHGHEHLVISAIQLVPVEGNCTAMIGCIRFYNHDCRD